MAKGNIGGGRALRVCDLCGGVDDHPRHVLAGGLEAQYSPPAQKIIQTVIDNSPTDERARLLQELMDTGSQDRHMDCCRAAGCPTGDCDDKPELTGKALLDHIVKASSS
jgi:hypothetical protein